MGSHREPKIAQNRQKSCSRGLPESTLKKVTKNDSIWKGQTSEFDDTYTLSAVFPVAQGSQKGAKKPPKMEPRGTPNHKKTRKMSTQKIIEKQDSQKSVFDLKNEVGIRADWSPKSHKSDSWAQDVPTSLQKSSNTQKNEKRHSMPRAICTPKMKKILNLSVLLLSCS